MPTAARCGSFHPLRLFHPGGVLYLSLLSLLLEPFLAVVGYPRRSCQYCCCLLLISLSLSLTHTLHHATSSHRYLCYPSCAAAAAAGIASVPEMLTVYLCYYAGLLPFLPLNNLDIFGFPADKVMEEEDE